MSDMPTQAAALQDSLVSLRRRLHAVPEVGLRLPKTQRIVIDEIESLGLEITIGRDLDSITALLRSPKQRPNRQAILLRADMDGLPLAESTGLDFAADTGTMHGCGHDLHTAMLIGAIRLLVDNRDRLDGDVVFMFQPGEEGFDGAARMLDEGLLESSDVPIIAGYALHVFSGGLAAGNWLVNEGTIMSASDRLHVTVRGRGGHGSAPHSAADPIAAAAEMITALQVMVTRRFDVFDPVVLTVTDIHSGQGPAIIPDTAEFTATVRSFSSDAQNKLERLTREVLEGVSDSHGLSVEVKYAKLYPATINDPSEARFAADRIAQLFGNERLSMNQPSLTASEDFSRVLQQLPGAFIPLGATPAGADPSEAAYNHSDRALFNESILSQGALLLADLAISRLQQEEIS